MSAGADDGPVCPCDFIEFFRGEMVRLVAVPACIGQVINERGWGAEYLVRIRGTFHEQWFQDVELETVEPDEPDPDGGNVIDFTRAKKLRETTKVKGAA